MADRDLTLERDDYDYDDRGERRRPLFNLLLLAIVVAAVCFVTAPYFAFRGLRAAAQYRDVAAVAQLVDFNAVRKAMLIEVEPGDPALVTAEPPSIWRDPLGAFKRAMGPIAPGPAEPSVDRFLTIEGLSALTRGYAPGDAPPLPATPPDLPSRARALISEPFPQIRYWDPNRVRIAVPRPGDNAKVTLFTFERRDWFTWKLVQISLPAGETPSINGPQAEN